MNCTYQDVEKRRAPIDPESDAQYIRNLEDRVRELESILQASNFRQNVHQGKDPQIGGRIQHSDDDTSEIKQAQNTTQVILRAVKTL